MWLHNSTFSSRNTVPCICFYCSRVWVVLKRQWRGFLCDTLNRHKKYCHRLVYQAVIAIRNTYLLLCASRLLCVALWIFVPFGDNSYISFFLIFTGTLSRKIWIFIVFLFTFVLGVRSVFLNVEGVNATVWLEIRLEFCFVCYWDWSISLSSVIKLTLLCSSRNTLKIV